MNKAQEMRQKALNNERCSDELVDKYYERCLEYIDFMSNRGYTSCDFWLYKYKDEVGQALNDEGCKKFLSKLHNDGFCAFTSIDVVGKPIVDMFDISW